MPAPASSASGFSPDGLRMLRAIDELPTEEQEVFDLVRIQGMTQAEAAQLLGVSVVTVKRRLSRGLRLLAEQLADLRPGEGPCSPTAQGTGSTTHAEALPPALRGLPGGEPRPFGDPRHAGSLEALWVHGQRSWLPIE